MFNAGPLILCNAQLPASFLAYFWPRPTSISTAMPGHQKNTSTHQGLLPVRTLDSSSHAVFQHHPNRLYSLRALVLLPGPKAYNTSSNFIPCRQEFCGPQQFLCYIRDFEIKETQKWQWSITATVQWLQCRASRRPSAQTPRRDRVLVGSLDTWSEGQKLFPVPILFCGIGRACLVST